MSIAGIFWLASLSYATNRNKEDIQALAIKQQKDIDAATLKHDNLDGKFIEIWKELNKISNTLARMEERDERG